MTTTISKRTELAHRSSDGLGVYLFWNEPTSRVTVAVFDARTDEHFELEVDGRDALDAFNHPYAYAARIDTADLDGLVDGLAARRDWRGDSQQTTTNPWGTDHAHKAR